MIKVKYCAGCTWAIPEDRSEWNLLCTNPIVNADDCWQLSASKISGSSCRVEREKSFWKLPHCGKSGRLWVEKSIVESAIK